MIDSCWKMYGLTTIYSSIVKAGSEGAEAHPSMQWVRGKAHPAWTSQIYHKTYWYTATSTFTSSDSFFCSQCFLQNIAVFKHMDNSGQSSQSCVGPFFRSLPFTYDELCLHGRRFRCGMPCFCLQSSNPLWILRRFFTWGLAGFCWRLKTMSELQCMSENLLDCVCGNSWQGGEGCYGLKKILS